MKKKSVKRILSGVMVLAVSIALCACGGDKNADKDAANNSQETAEDTTEEKSEDSAAGEPTQGGSAVSYTHLEALEEAARSYEKALEDEEVQKEIYEASEEFWAENGILQTVGLSEAQDGEMLDFHAVHTHVQSRNEDGYTDAVVALASARQTWHDACLAWYEPVSYTHLRTPC